MKNPAVIGGIILLVLGLIFLGVRMTPEKSSENREVTETNIPEVAQAITITPIEHATAVINIADIVVYTDPIGGGIAFSGKPSADIILLTDIHGDHFNTSTLSAVVHDKTVIIAPAQVAAQLPTTLKDKTTVLANGEKAEIKGVSIEAIPMYNIPERADEAHTKGRGNGYVLEKDGARVYVAGDTEGTSEMRALKNIHVALIPMSLPYTMSVEDASEAVLAFAPTMVYPYHFRGSTGLSDIEKFKELVKKSNSDIEVVLLDWYPVESSPAPDATTGVRVD
ncbi:TPA: MBL fold metallo-hydrolase [Patescibacteria group bacterium]|nr:MAG: hypothetical protein UU98_C0016G0023 [Parcubacteria group bacterium GW2011_GWD2_42_14]HCC04733.1 MBL fold metallo-hydrolase [Patescibacteria group bacterium]